MLRTRILTALAILPVVLGLLAFASRWLWALFATLVVLVGCWEWSRLCGLAAPARRGFLVFSGVAGGSLVTLYLISPGALYGTASWALLWAAAAFWVAVVPWWLLRGVHTAPLATAAAGWLALWPFWIALVDLRDRGRALLLAIAVVVWVADIAAYFAGGWFGRRKLAPSISPKKTLEGALGAFVAVFAYGVGLLAWSSGGIEPTAWWPVFLAALMVLTAAAIVGDLFESWVKRGAGVKDSSGLLPGHGGVLDRIDALTSTLPLAALMVAYKGSGPA